MFYLEFATPCIFMETFYRSRTTYFDNNSITAAFIFLKFLCIVIRTTHDHNIESLFWINPVHNVPRSTGYNTPALINFLRLIVPDVLQNCIS